MEVLRSSGDTAESVGNFFPQGRVTEELGSLEGGSGVERPQTHREGTGHRRGEDGDRVQGEGM